MKRSPIAALFLTDAYKQSHVGLLPKGTTYAYSNFTNRSSRLDNVTHVVNFGLQAFLQKLNDSFAEFFAADEDEVVRLYENRVEAYLFLDKVDATHVRKLHQLGYLPLRFKQVEEGTLVPLKVPSITFENTHPEFAWLTNYIETFLSAEIWHPSSVATLAAMDRKQIEAWDKKTGGNCAGVDYQYHDFSYRGQTSSESAAASGAGHLLSFLGSDTLPAIDWVEEYYHGENGLILASVPATEHAIMSSGTAVEDEESTYRRILTEHYPKGIVSIVSDTYSIWNVVEPGGILDNLRDVILNRPGKLVTRPDSGDPVKIITGENSEFGAGKTPEEKGVIELLWDVFGGTINEAGFKELDSHIGVIYGDGITPERMEQIFSRLAAKGFAASNIVYGIGSYRYQVISRDSVGGSAVKLTAVETNNQLYNIFKDPITAKGGTKKSATGLLKVIVGEDKDLHLIEKVTPEEEATGELKTVWENGKFVRYQSFADVRKVLKSETWKLDK